MGQNITVFGLQTRIRVYTFADFLWALLELARMLEIIHVFILCSFVNAPVQLSKYSAESSTQLTARNITVSNKKVISTGAVAAI